MSVTLPRCATSPLYDHKEEQIENMQMKKPRWNKIRQAKKAANMAKVAKAPEKAVAQRSSRISPRAEQRGHTNRRAQSDRGPQATRPPLATNQKKLKTLDRVISKAGLGSRREARSWIGSGRVAVNGKKIQTPDHWVDVASDRVTLDGRPMGAARKVYLLLYKPKGYLTTYKDPEGRRTVYDLMPGIDQFISPVGRLDLDSSGLLIMTNDTDFGNHIMSPESKVAKTYLVKSSLLLSDEQLDRLRAGMELADGPTRPAIVNRIRDSARYTFFEITISEGRNRQVRRMVEALGAKVLKLVRVAIGPIRIGDLQIGTYREMTAAEVSQLYGRTFGRAAGGGTVGGREAGRALGSAERRNARIDSSSRSS
jgi:23S rRNA pseudouridine2605 synthase